LHALARQIAHGTMFRRQDSAGWKDAQSQQVRQMAGIGFVAAVLQTIIFLDRVGVGEENPVASSLQAIDQPVPVERRLDHHTRQRCLPRQEKDQNLRQVVGQSLLATTRSSSSVTVTALLFE